MSKSPRIQKIKYIGPIIVHICTGKETIIYRVLHVSYSILWLQYLIENQFYKQIIRFMLNMI